MNLAKIWSKERDLKMIWRLEKDNRTSFLVGTAHFFPYSFATSLKALLNRVDIAIFEGPLDEQSLSLIAEHGRDGQDSPNLKDLLDERVVRQIDHLLRKRLDGSGEELMIPPWTSSTPYFDLYTRGVRPWLAMFSIWTAYLDWRYSVDLEAFQLARRSGKKICFLESLEEQLEVLDTIPLHRILNHFNSVASWKTYKDNFMRYFLSGDLTELLSLTDHFPTRTPIVISQRDCKMFERLLPFVEEKPTLACVGVPHIPRLNHLFCHAGYEVSQGLCDY